MTLLEERVGEDGRVFLHASVTMPSLEVAAIGGGSNLEPQKSIVRDMTMGSGDKPGDKGNLSQKKLLKNKEIKARKINFHFAVPISRIPTNDFLIRNCLP